MKAKDASGDLLPVNTPTPIRASVAPDGRLRGVRLGDTWHRVTAVVDTWRIDDRWWEVTEVSRMYHEVELEGGRRVTVFEDLIGGAWYSQQQGSRR